MQYRYYIATPIETFEVTQTTYEELASRGVESFVVETLVVKAPKQPRERTHLTLRVIALASPCG